MAANGNMHNFTTLIKRLEAATSRLEDMASSLDGPSASSASVTPNVPQRSDSKTPEAQKPESPASEPLPACIEAFDAIISKEVKAFVESSQQLGGLVAEQSKAVLKAFEAERKYLLVSTKAKRPEQQPPELFTDLHRASDEINNLREGNRHSPFFNHLSAVAEGIVALGWFFETKPATFVTDTLGGAQFFGNRVLKEYKEKDKTQVAYIQAYYRIFKSLIVYIEEFYPKGITWNNQKGVDVMEALKQVSSSPLSSSSRQSAGPPPPPPLPTSEQLGAPLPPPPPPPGAAPSLNSSSSNDMTAVFDQLNQGSAVTSSLRKVDDSQKTHKNPSLRAQSVIPENGISKTSVKSPAPSKKPKPENMRVKKPARKELQGTKWYIEYFDCPNEVVEINAELNHSILISRCNKTIIKVNGKANAISADNCNGLSVILDSLVSSLEAIKCPNLALQLDGIVPTVVLDQVDGASLYLNQNSMNTEVFSSKCTAVNLILPPSEENQDSDAKECPIPEQIRSYIKDGAIVNEIVDHAG
ncbi:hypothetical protein FQN57_003873 [Myotisia sp. PD_48]|nr:hypothetical protein FQN57_003873 [Myotisia sp. PD_48]